MIALTFDRALEAAGEKEAAPGGETVFARKKKEIKGADDETKWTADSRFLGAVLNKLERKQFRDIVDNMQHLKVDQAANGEYIVEAGRCLVYTDGNAEDPKVFRVVKFNTDDGTELSFMVDYYKKAEKGGMVFDEIRVLLEGMFDKGIALEYTNAVHLPVWRKKRGSEGGSRYSISEGNRGEVSAEGEEVISNSGLSVSDDGEIAYPAVQETMYSLRTLPETDYIKERDKSKVCMMDIHGATSSK